MLVVVVEWLLIPVHVPSVIPTNCVFRPGESGHDSSDLRNKLSPRKNIVPFNADFMASNVNLFDAVNSVQFVAEFLELIRKFIISGRAVRPLIFAQTVARLDIKAGFIRPHDGKKFTVFHSQFSSTLVGNSPLANFGEPALGGVDGVNVHDIVFCVNQKCLLAVK